MLTLVRSNSDRAPHEPALCHFRVDVVPSVFREYGGRRNGHDAFVIRDGEGDRGEHLGLETASRIRNADPYLCASRRRIDRVADVFDAALKLFTRIRRRRHDSWLARADEPQIAFEQVT